MKKLSISLLCLILSVSLTEAQSLNDYWQMAAQQNPNLKAEFNEYLAALERVDQQSALPDPNLSFGYFISPVETRVGAQRFKISLSQMFPWIGTNATKESYAAKMAEVEYAEFVEARNKLFLEVTEAWLQLSELLKEIDLKEQNLRLLKSYEPIAKTKYESNLTSLSDLLRIEIRIQQASTELEILYLKKTPLMSDFNTLLNREEHEEINTDLSLGERQNLSLDSALVNNPKLLANRQKQEGAALRIELSELQQRPSFGFGLDYAFVSERTDINVEDNGKDILMPMLSVSLPIFGKKNKALKKEAELNNESLAQRKIGLENEIKNDWTKADFLERSAEKELSLYEKEIRNTQSLLNVLTSEYSNNSSNFEELLLTQQRLFQLQIAQVKAAIQKERALFQKKYLTGKFFNQ